MSDLETPSTDRRTFLQAGALTTAASARFPRPAPRSSRQSRWNFPGDTLGKTGVQVTMLEQGTVLAPALTGSCGFPTQAECAFSIRPRSIAPRGSSRSGSSSRPRFASRSFWSPRTWCARPPQMLKTVDERLAALGTDYIDLYFIHGLGDEHSLDDAMNLVKSQEFKEVAESLRKSGKAKFIGFSTHHKNRAQILQAAASGGIVDAIMLQYHPWLDKDSPLNKAIDACWKQGIGLISMKQIASHRFGDTPKGDILKDVVEKVPMLKERKLSPFQGLLHAIWTDERISSRLYVDEEH